MALTGAERQRRYRQKHLKDFDAQLERLQCVVSLHAKRALERLAVFYGLSQRDMLEQVINEAEQRLTAQLTGSEQDQFYDRTLTAQSLQRNEAPREPNGLAAKD